MSPKFCPPHKTSLPSSSRKLRWTLIDPHLSPHPNTDSFSNIYYRPLLFTYLITTTLFSFCTFLTRTCLKDSVPKEAGYIWGPLAYLSKQLYLVRLRWPSCVQALVATTVLIPETQKLTWNALLNVCPPHSFKDLLSNRAFLSLPLLNYKSSMHTSLTHPFLWCVVNLLILLGHSLRWIQKQNTCLMTVFRP